MKYIRFKFIFKFLTLFLLCSCNLISYEKLEITSYPQERDEIIDTDESIRFTISPSPDHDSVEQIFTLKLEDITVPGDFVWVGDTFTYRPLEGWRIGDRYTYAFDGEIKTEKELEFTVKKTNTFYVGLIADPLMVTEFSPINEAITNVTVPLEITFNNPVNRESFELEFSISPDADYNIEWDSTGTLVTISPVDMWTVNTRSNWKITEELKAVNGQHILKEQSHYFITSEDSIFEDDVELHLVVYNKASGTYALSGLDIDQVTPQYQILLLFPEAINTNKIADQHSITPALAHETIILSPTEIILSPIDTYAPQEQYTLTLDTTITDISGNNNIEEISWEMNCQNINYQTVVSVSTNSGDIIYGEGAITESIPLVESAGTILQQLIFVFSEPIRNPDTQYIMASEDIVLSGFFPLSVMNPTPTIINWSDNNTLNIVFIDFQYSPDIAANLKSYYSLLIKGGTEATKTEDGSYIEEDIIIYFSTEEDSP